jgi:hypothetical protein
MPTTVKPKQRLCCMMRPLGECRYCSRVVCSNHGKGIYETQVIPGSIPELLSVHCLSTKCNDSVHKDRHRVYQRQELRRRMREAAGLTPYPINQKGKALLDRITSQKVKRSISKISHRKGRKH